MPGRTVGDKKILSRKEQNRINQRACRERKRRLQEMQQAMGSKEALEPCGSQSGISDVYRAASNQEIYRGLHMAGSFEDTGVPVDAATMPSMIGSATRQESSFLPSQGLTGAHQEHAKIDLGTTIMDTSPPDRGSGSMLPGGITSIEMQEEVSNLNTHVDVPASPTKRVAHMSSMSQVHNPTSPPVTQSLPVARAVYNPAGIDALAGCPEDVRDLRAEMQEIREMQTQIMQLLHLIMDRLQDRAAPQMDASLQKVVTLEILASTPKRENERTSPPVRD